MSKLLAAAVIFFQLFVQNVQAERKIKIGVSTALTGNAATYGVDLKNALLFANEKLANNKYEFVFEDDKCNGKDAVAVAHRFVDVLGLKYTIGFACSSTILSAAQVYERAGAIAMVTSASAAKIANAGDYIFRTWASDRAAARKLYDYIASKHSSIGVFSEQTDYAQGFLRSFTEDGSAVKLSIENENFFSDMLDFRTGLLKLKVKGVQGLFINSQTEATFLAVLKQVREMNWNVPIYGAYWASSPSFLANAKEMANGIVCVDLPSVEDTLSAEGKRLFSEFERVYGKVKSVELMFATTVEGFRALHQAIESGQDARRYLYETKFNGLLGEWSFDKNGEIQGLNFVLKRIENGKAVTMK